MIALPDEYLYVYDFKGNLLNKFELPGSTVVDIEISADQVYILYIGENGQKYINIYNLDHDFRLYGIISSDTVKNFPYSEWSPMSIRVNPAIPGVIFVKGSNFITLLGVVNNEVVFLKNQFMTIPNTSKTWDFVITAHSMFVLCDGPDGFIHELSLNNLDYLAYMKSLPLYD